MNDTPTDNAWLDELFDTFLSNVYADSVDESSTVRAVVKREVASAFMKSAKAHIASQVSSAVVEAREPYNELIMAVGNKYAGETRHETALRYIRQAEAPTENTATLNVNTKELKDD